MSDILHRIAIKAPPEKVYDAITTSEGLRSWWTVDATHERKVGSVAEFGFHKRAVVFRMRIKELKPGERIVWECEGDDPEWKGTRVTFDLEPHEGGTLLEFSHTGWRSVEKGYRSCNTVWGFLMHSLMRYCEGRPTEVYFPE